MSQPSSRATLRHVPAAVEPLFLPGEPGQDDRGGEGTRVAAQHPGGLDGARHAARVVVGARRIVGEVVRVGDPAVDVPGHDDDPVRLAGPPQGREDVHHLGVHRNAASLPPRNHRSLVGDLETASAGIRDPGEFRVDPAPRGADPAGLALGFGEGVPRAEPHQGADVGLDAVRGDVVEEVVHSGIPSRRLAGLGRSRCRQRQRSNQGEEGEEARRHGGGLYHRGCASGPLPESPARALSSTTCGRGRSSTRPRCARRAT